MVVTRIVVSIITFLVIGVLFLISDDDGEVDVTNKAKDDDVIYDELDFTEATHDDVIYDGDDDDVITLKGGGDWDKGEDDYQRHY